MPALTFTADCRMLATVELRGPAVADVEVLTLPDGRLSIELADQETGVLLVGAPQVVLGLILEAARALRGQA